MASRKRLRDWGQPAARAAEITKAVGSDPEPAKRSPGRKDTRQWCRGKQSREHVPVIVFRPPWTRKPVQCEWSSRWVDDGVAWRCHHEEHCHACGKILRTSLADAECPAYPGSPEQRAEAEVAAAIATQRWAEWRQSRRRVITGPQSYRRKRNAGDVQ